MEEIKVLNKVAASGLVTLDPATYLDSSSVAIFDLKDELFQEQILREKDFRESMKQHDWEQYRDQFVAVICSVDAIIPTWAYMLLASYFQPVVKKVIYGPAHELYRSIIMENFRAAGLESFEGKRVVIKGCGDPRIPESVYFELALILKPVVKSLMFGEPCSTVPIFKTA